MQILAWETCPSLVLYVWRKIVFDGQMSAGIAHLPTNTRQLQWSEKQGADMRFLGDTDTEQRCTLEEYIESHQPTWATAESGRRYMYTLTCCIMMPFDLLGLHLYVVVHVLLQFPPSMEHLTFPFCSKNRPLWVLIRSASATQTELKIIWKHVRWNITETFDTKNRK